MGQVSSGIVSRSVFETPVAVIDLETTGLSPGLDRVVEISVVRVPPGQPPELVLDTLINPCRPVAATEIHGITDDDVCDAPTFEEIAGDLVRAISGCVVAAYNVYFDIKFLSHELYQAGIKALPPHLCLMYLRPMLGIGSRCPLQDACSSHGIKSPVAHAAPTDAAAAAELMNVYYEWMKKHDVETFGDLARLKKYKFVDSFVQSPFEPSLVAQYDKCGRLKPRFGPPVEAPTAKPAAAEVVEAFSRNPLAEYFEALKVALADLRITDEETRQLREKKRSLGLQNEQVRMLHARLFAAIISEFTGDKWLDDRECKILHRVHSSLQQLGWAPGDPPPAPGGRGRASAG